MSRKDCPNKGWLDYKKIGVLKLKAYMKVLEGDLIKSIGEKTKNLMVRTLVDRYCELEYLLCNFRNELAACSREISEKKRKGYESLVASQRMISDQLQSLTNSKIGNELKSLLH